jgi:predicted DNA-binding protein (MmcQ/YjbR family)
MNKDHWNTVILDGGVPPEEIESMIDTSYSLVVQNLRKSDRLSLEIKYGKNQIYLTK